MIGKPLALVLCLILASLSMLTFRIEPTQAGSTIIVPDDYPTIQEAIDNAISGDVVFVRSGVYSENIVIEYSSDFTLIGEDNSNTILNGSVLERDVENITIENLQLLKTLVFGRFGPYDTIRNCIIHGSVTMQGSDHIFENNLLYNGLSLGAYMHETPTRNEISNNMMINSGVSLASTTYTLVTGNTILNASIGILESHGKFDAADIGAFNNQYIRNDISFCDAGLEFTNTKGGGEEFYNPHSWCTIRENLFRNNTLGIHVDWVDELNACRNDFINNTNQVCLNYTGFNPPFNLSNTFDNGFPYGGNYWTDYDGSDILSGPNQNETRRDGIGDTPYLVGQNDTDNYPLMSPFFNHTIYVPTRYETIQKAMISAKTGDTIFVLSGTYEERDPQTGERTTLYIDKAVSLVGEAPLTTVVSPGETYVIADDVSIQGLTFHGTFYHAYGLVVQGVWNTTITNCYIHSETALYIYGGGNHSVTNCRIYGDRAYGLRLQDSESNYIYHNSIEGQYSGAVRLDTSSQSLFTLNTLSALDGPCVSISASSNNTFHHNNLFWGCIPSPPISTDSSINTWDDDYPSGGNYWDSYYSGVDEYNGVFQNETGSDGIGDTPCLIAPNNRDNYPLMGELPQWKAMLDVAIKSTTPSKTVVTSGYSVSINVLVKNEGFYTSPITSRLTLNVTHIYEPLTHNAELFGSAASGWNYSIPGPTITTYLGDTLKLTLIGTDNIHHKFYVDYNGNEFPDTGEPQTDSFINTTINYEFQTLIAGNFTYYCAYNQGTMFGTLIVSEQPSPIPVTIGSQNVTLSSLEGQNVIFIWNTTGFLKGNYTLTASIEPITGEWNVGNNELVSNKKICITIAGDVDADHDVDIFDIVLMAGAYGTSIGDVKYAANCDIDGDGDIDIFDIVRAAGNYGKSW